MILELSKPPYDIGVRRVGCNGSDGVWRAEQPFVIVREVSQDDWIAQCLAHKIPIRIIARQLAVIGGKGRFFEVGID